MKILSIFFSIFKTILIFIVFFSNSLWANDNNNLLQFEFKDSLNASGEISFLRNNLTISNISNNKLRFSVNVLLPQGFNLVSRNDVTLELAPGESQIMPLTISKEKLAPALKQNVKITAKIDQPARVLSYQFTIQCEEFKSLRVIPVISEFQVSPDSRHVSLSLRIKNIGNATNSFNVHFINKYLFIDKKVNLTLLPFRDTIYTFEFTIPAGLVNGLENEKVTAFVGDESSFHSYGFYLSRVKENNKQHPSAYQLMPLYLETGVFLTNSEFSYFWGIGGALAINKNNLLSFSYRSKQYGLNSIQNDIFSVFYQHKNWNVNFGQMTGSSDFMSNGLGVEVRYSKNELEGFSAMAISNISSLDSLNRNETLIFNTNYKIGKLFWRGLVEVNQDPVLNTLSSIFSNKLDLIQKEKIHLGVILGAGMEKKDLREKEHTAWGYSYGYDFTFQSEKVNIYSRILLNNNDYPGLYKGWRNIDQGIDYNISKRITTGLFFNSNFTRQNFFIDSIFYDNQFLYNQTNYGFRVGYHQNKFDLNLGFGQSKSSGSVLLNNIPFYHSVFGGLNILISPDLRFSFNSTVNFDLNYGPEKQQVIYYAHNATVLTKFGGIMANLMKTPYVSPNLDIEGLTEFRSSISFSPFINYGFFHNRLKFRAQYNYFEVSQLNRQYKMQTLVGSLLFNNDRKGVEFQVFGNYAVDRTLGTSDFLSFSVKKSLNVPIITSRKYYNLNLFLFEDQNGNGIWDKKEPFLSQTNVQINSVNFISNNKGAIQYGNVEKGVYKIDFHGIKNEKGLIPSFGFSQNVLVDGQTTVFMPFNKGKVIKGKVDLTLDSISQNSFTVNHLKVTAMDSIGNRFETFTNEEGTFRLNVPSGKYILSLNPEAFSDVFKPIQMAFQVDLIENESYSASFHIVQKRREVKRVKAQLD